MSLVIKVENISKAYQIGQFTTGTLSNDINRWWSMLRGKGDPYLKIGEINDRSKGGKSNIVWSLKDINFEINSGDTVGIIGSNGAGKSTLLKLLSQVTTPSKGKIKLKGKIASLLEVGTGFHPELTGRENIYLNGAILGMTKAEIKSKFDEIVDFSGVERYIDTPVKRYSSGMYVRLAFAVAAHLDSEILIVDEVLAVGDAEFQKKCLGKMNDISGQRGTTVLFVSHNLASIVNLCKHSILLEKGSLVEYSITNDVINTYIQKKSNVGVQLSTLDDRIGFGNLKWQETWTENTQNIRVSKIEMGCNFNIKAKFKVINSIERSDLQFAFAIETLQGIGITDLSSTYTTIEKFIPKLLADDILEVSCIINNINIVPGLYRYNLMLRNFNDVEDFILHAGEFEIIDNDFFKTGKFFDTRHGLISLNQSWHLNK